MNLELPNDYKGNHHSNPLIVEDCMQQQQRTQGDHHSNRAECSWSSLRHIVRYLANQTDMVSCFNEPLSQETIEEKGED